MKLFPASWIEVFSLETPLLELVVRGSILYLAILILMRLMPRRTGGELATMDLIFIVLIAEAAASGVGEYSSVADGLVLILVFMGWNYLLNILTYYVPAVEWLTSSPPLEVIRDGRLLRRNMRREYLTEEELLSHLREQGIDDFKQVRKAFVEPEGKVTFVIKDSKR
jgi:uncharacterized membrane protein YcaP (DUF421 family)